MLRIRKRRANKPSTLEVIDAIFGIFTEEELEYMKDNLEMPGEATRKGAKEMFYACQDTLKPKYSLERSVFVAKRIVDPLRKDLKHSSTRGRVCRELFLRLFHS